MATLLILVPFLFLLVINFLFTSKTAKISFWLCGLLFVIQAYLVITEPMSFWQTAVPIVDKYFPFSLHLDNLTLVMLLSSAIVAFVSLLTGFATITDEKKKFNFVNVLVLALAGMNGIVLVKDLFSLYIFLEITAVSSFILIALNRDKAALEGTFKYLILSAVATVMILSSIAILVMFAGDTSFASVAKVVSSGHYSTFFLLIAVCFFVGGLFIKAGLVPFHGWLPDAYQSAPASVSVFLAGIVTKTTGVYTLIRLTTAVFGFSGPYDKILLFVGMISIIVGAFAALAQKDFKRMLAYSSISQVGYIVLALGAGTPLGIAGAVFHLFNHSIFKTQLFVNSAALEEETKTLNMNELGGLQSRMPVTSATSLIALLSTAGVPPFSGFWSKLIIIIALWNSNNKVYAFLAIVMSVVTLAYFLSMNNRVFFGKLNEKLSGIKEAKPAILAAVVLLSVITIGVGIFFPVILNSFILPVQSIFE